MRKTPSHIIVHVFLKILFTYTAVSLVTKKKVYYSFIVTIYKNVCCSGSAATTH